MTEPIRILSINDKNVIKKMPIYIKSRAIEFIVIFFVIFVFLPLMFFFGSVTVKKQFIEVTIIYTSLFCLVLLFLFKLAIKQSSFVMAADANGIYCRVFGEKYVFVLIEWRCIDEIYSIYRYDGACLVVKTMIKNHSIPHICNAIFYKSRKTKDLIIEFNITQLQSLKIVHRLNDLRISSQNAILA